MNFTKFFKTFFAVKWLFASISHDTGQISYGELERVTFPKFIKYFEDESSQLANASVYNIEETKLWHDEDEMLVFDDVFQDYHQR